MLRLLDSDAQRTTALLDGGKVVTTQKDRREHAHSLQTSEALVVFMHVKVMCCDPHCCGAMWHDAW